MQEKTNIVKEIQIGATKVKFCNDYIAKTKEERETRIREFKQAGLNLMQNNKWKGLIQMKRLKQNICDTAKFIGLLSTITSLWAVANILANMI